MDQHARRSSRSGPPAACLKSTRCRAERRPPPAAAALSSARAIASAAAHRTSGSTGVLSGAAGAEGAADGEEEAEELDADALEEGEGEAGLCRDRDSVRREGGGRSEGTRSSAMAATVAADAWAGYSHLGFHCAGRKML